MAYDEDLADRLRELLGEEEAVTERNMFGGVAFLLKGTGLAAGILLDAAVIRALIVPAVIALMGRWNWWLPRWPARLLGVEPSSA